MNDHLTKQILDDHFWYFRASLLAFSSRYLPMVFRTPETIEQHVAYICPLCLDNYILLISTGVFATCEFSLDHFPPKSVGGRSKILTCKKCNNEAGALYESELQKKMEYAAMNVNTQGSYKDTSTQITGIVGNYTSLFKKIEEGKFFLDFPEKLKKKAPFLKEWIDSGSKSRDWELKLKINWPNDKKVAKSLLKAAYLICFVHWGYDFAFHSNASNLLNLLNDNDKDPINLIPFWIDDLGAKETIPLGLCIIEHPVEMKSIVVNIQLQIENYLTVASVIIPFANDDGWKKIEATLKFLKDKSDSDNHVFEITISIVKQHR